MDNFQHPMFPSSQENEDFSSVLFSSIPRTTETTIINNNPISSDDDDSHSPFLFQQPYPTLLLPQQQEDLHQFDVDVAAYLDNPVDAAGNNNNLIAFNSTPGVGNDNYNMGKKQQQQKKSSAQGESSTKKRVMHRDIERQRRQEMANLYASLRIQLPLDYIKGKRSTSDHVMEAVNYIEDKQKSIKELEEKRDKLKRLISWSRDDGEDYPTNDGIRSSSSAIESPAIVKLQPCLDGVEILINSGFPKQGFRISRALQLLLQQGFHVLSCVCSRVDDRLLHTIRAQVAPQAGVDLQELQRNLSDAVNK